MKATRRGFLGIMGGGVVAGPKLATSLISDASSFPPSFWGMPLTSAGSSGDYKTSRIAELRRMLAGGDMAAQRKRSNVMYSMEQRERFRLDGLRSVSPSHRHAMFVAGNVERQEAINRMHWEFELSELTGGIL